MTGNRLSGKAPRRERAPDHQMLDPGVLHRQQTAATSCVTGQGLAVGTSHNTAKRGLPHNRPHCVPSTPEEGHPRVTSASSLRVGGPLGTGPAPVWMCGQADTP